MRKNRQDNMLFAKAVLLFIMMALPAGILMHLAWRGYEEKMEILYVVLEQQSDGAELIDTVIGLLKGQIVTEVSDAEQNLGQYGFHENFVSRYKKLLYCSWTAVCVIFCLLYAGILVLLYLIDNRRKLMRKNELVWMQEQVIALRDIASGSLCGAQLVNQQDILEEYDEDLGRFLSECVSLADSIALFRQQAEVEREGTKMLVTDISHQLKTPVAALKTSFEILQSDGLSAVEYQEFLGRCRIQILRLEELVSALVNISRMEAGMIELKKVERNLFDTILLAVNRIYPKSEEKAIAIELEAEKELQQVKVYHDPKWLCEAFLNVLENAVKYSANHTKITIRMIRMTVYLRIEIEDEGIGIPRKEWNRIFQRFYRGEAKEVQEESGSGVGLYLAREIISRHEGTLAVSAPHSGKHGSCFVFQLPCLTSEME